MSTNAKNFILAQGEGKIILVPGHKVTIKLNGEDTDGAFSLLEVELTGDGPPQHIHKTEDETFYVLEGEVKFLLGDNTSIAKAGTFVSIPRGVRHAFCRIDKKNAKLLATFTPAGFEKFFEDAVDMDVSDTEAYIAKGKELADKYNMEIVGPPLDS
jgi:quercetin dioxygenase-like cupin family protein